MSRREKQTPPVPPPPSTRNLFEEVLDPLLQDLSGIISGDVHVSAIKEEMMKVWSSGTGEEKKAAAQKLVDALTQVSLSIESLKQEFTVATVGHRQ